MRKLDFSGGLGSGLAASPCQLTHDYRAQVWCSWGLAHSSICGCHRTLQKSHLVEVVLDWFEDHFCDLELLDKCFFPEHVKPTVICKRGPRAQICLFYKIKELNNQSIGLIPSTAVVGSHIRTYTTHWTRSTMQPR